MEIRGGIVNAASWTLAVRSELIEQIAERAADILMERLERQLGSEHSPVLSVNEAAN